MILGKLKCLFKGKKGHLWMLCAEATPEQLKANPRMPRYLWHCYTCAASIGFDHPTCPNGHCVSLGWHRDDCQWCLDLVSHLKKKESSHV